MGNYGERQRRSKLQYGAKKMMKKDGEETMKSSLGQRIKKAL